MQVEHLLEHCDLKPGNIFLRYAPGPHHIPAPILADFGNAAKISSVITQLTIQTGVSGTNYSSYRGKNHTGYPTSYPYTIS